MSGEEQVPISSEEAFEEAFPDQFFVVLTSTGDEVELCPGGRSRRVTFANRGEYSDLAQACRLGEFDEQV